MSQPVSGPCPRAEEQIDRPAAELAEGQGTKGQECLGGCSFSEKRQNMMLKDAQWSFSQFVCFAALRAPRSPRPVIQAANKIRVKLSLSLSLSEAKKGDSCDPVFCSSTMIH